MCPNSKFNFLAASLLLIASLNSACAEEPIPAVASEADEKVVNRIIEESSGIHGLLRSMGLKNVNIVSAEFKAGISSDGSNFTEGPEVVLDKQISDHVRAQVKLAFTGLIRIENGRVQTNRDWNEFFKEAKIIIDQDKDSKIPFVTIIGKQEIETSGFDSEMPIDDNELLHGLTRIEKAYAVQFQMGPELIKGIDSVMIAGFNTGSGSRDTMGENIQPASNGAMIVLTKKLSDQIILSGGLTRIAYPEHAEARLNWGIVYQSKDGKNKIFFNQAIFKYNPLYVDSKNVWTVGYVRKLTEKDSVTVEASRVNGLKTEMALGYTHQITKRGSVGVEVRKTKCFTLDNCTDGVIVNGQFKYSWDKN